MCFYIQLFSLLHLKLFSKLCEARGHTGDRLETHFTGDVKQVTSPLEAIATTTSVRPRCGGENRSDFAGASRSADRCGNAGSACLCPTGASDLRKKISARPVS